MDKYTARYSNDYHGWIVIKGVAGSHLASIVTPALSEDIAKHKAKQANDDLEKGLIPKI